MELSELVKVEQKDEASVIAEIENRVQELLDKDPALLFSYMYRLDVEEQELKQILSTSSESGLATLLAKSIWERQKKRLQWKKNVQVKDLGEEWSF